MKSKVIFQSCNNRKALAIRIVDRTGKILQLTGKILQLNRKNLAITGKILQLNLQKNAGNARLAWLRRVFHNAVKMFLKILKMMKNRSTLTFCGKLGCFRHFSVLWYTPPRPPTGGHPVRGKMSGYAAP